MPQEHPARRSRTDMRRAMKLCDACPVRKSCLADALAFGNTTDQSIYGGLTRLQRILLLRMMRATKAPGIPAARVKRHNASQCMAYRNWLENHGDAIEQVRAESKRYWSRYYQLRKQQQAQLSQAS